MASQFMVSLFEPSVYGLSLRCNLNRIATDVSGDGQVTSLDALMILQMAEVPT